MNSRMKNINKVLKRLLTTFVCFTMLVTLIPLTAVQSFAAVIDNDADGPVVVTSVKYAVNHNVFAASSGYVEIIGTNLLGVDFLFDVAGEGFNSFPNKTTNTNTFVKYDLSRDEVETFLGRIKAGAMVINLNSASFPNIQSSDKQTINIDDTQPYLLTFNGNYLNTLNTGNITGTYGAGLSSTTLGTGLTSNQLVLTNATNPGRLGYQNIVINKTDTGVDPQIEIEYTYQNAFRIIEDLGIEDTTMFPNTGSKGDEVYFTGNNFSDTRNYQVYFLKALDGSDPYTTTNRATFVSLGLNVNGDEDRLTVKVPESVDFERRNYYVVITDVLNGQIVAEQIVRNTEGDYDQYTVIESGYKPTIETVYPEKGPDTGGNVQLSGRNLVTLSIPDLVATGAFLNPPTTESNEEVLVIDYAAGTYKGEAVNIERKINVQIGKKTTFSKNTSGVYQVVRGIPDSMIVTTDVIDDAETDPIKDIVIEIVTTLTVTTPGVNFGKRYIFNQSVTKTDGFEFEPSSYTPIIDSITPNIVQIEDYDANYLNFVNKTQIAIKGERFLVDRFVDASGNIITQYPTVLIKKNDDNTFNSRYQLGFFPNETETDTATGLIEVRGIIKYKLDENSSTEYVLRDAVGLPVQFTMTVLDDDNSVVDGTSGNQLGTKIILTAPSSTLIADAGIKHLQVTNPTRDSTEFGRAAIRSDFIEFIKTSDIPVIESVKPNIVTVEGGQGIIITGSNFQEGIRIFLDGDEITSFARTLDNTGTKLNITFIAPPGRDGTTQLQLMNPSGGMAVSDFTYVTTFNEEPVITNFTPAMGSYDTLVVVNGDNFLKADPTAISESGINAYRLMGTRVLLDGEEVNSYNTNVYGNVSYINYLSPDEDVLIYNDYGQATYSDFYENTIVRRVSDGVVMTLGNDASNNPAIYSESGYVGFSYVSGQLTAFDATGNVLGDVVQTLSMGTTTIFINGTATYTVEMDNKLVRVNEDTDGSKKVSLADYAQSVILYSGTDYFTISYNFNNEVILTNGKDRTYTLSLDATDQIVGTTNIGTSFNVNVDITGIQLNGLSLLMRTPYTVDANGNISGNRVKVLSKTQLVFTVPYISTGRGYKDLTVMNPDTKSASRTGTGGFYYVSQATSTPAITSIVPDKGSTDGGYYIKISGSQFEDGAKVYIDSVLVPTADTYVALNGTSINVKVPASIKDLVEDYGVDSLAVPVVVINEDGGNAYKLNGFTYIIPQSEPSITQVISTTGSSNGGEIVEIIGYEFRFYEPYTNSVGSPSYDVGDEFEDIFSNGQWDDLLSNSLDPDAITTQPELTNDYYDNYYESVILPKVYFGENEAKIVEFAKGYLKVITPSHASGAVDVYVINNDSGVSNKVKYTYSASQPTITTITPSFGKRSGNEPKDIYGTKFYQSQIYGYKDDDPSSIQYLDNVNALVRFGEIDNIDSVRTDTDYGLINSQRASVSLTGGLMMSYYGDLNELRLTITENNVIYSRTFTYDDTTVYIPTGMLQNSVGNYYVPNGLSNISNRFYSGNAYELIKVEIVNRRLVVSRGYSPEVTYDNDTHVKVVTPPYYTIGTVKVTYTNKDGGSTSKNFSYTNPDSEPKIYDIAPKEISYDETAWLTESSYDGGIDIEITGEDFRVNPTVYIGSYKATVKELTTKDINGVTYDLLVVTVPKGSINDVDKKYPFIIQNEDMGLATSDNMADLIGPNYNLVTIPFYFVYKQPLSNPKISTVTPTKTSIAGGNPIIITGSDFRTGAYVVIGTRAGIPIYDATISNAGSQITFLTPTNMTLGTKTVQVLNNDFGIGIANNAITVVSAPTLNGAVYDVDGNVLDRIHVTGGQEIMLKGTGFAEGASVYFGGTWMQVPTGTTVSDSEIGIFTNDDEYYVSQGFKGSKVTFVDENTLLVTTPEVDFEGEVTIVVRNSDSGITSNNTVIDYTVPIPENPTGLSVDVINDQYIKLYDYTSSSADYFEIYVYMGLKSNYELTSNNYKDFKYLGVTNIEPYKITTLPGLENLESTERIVFVIKGVNKFGPSGYSNLAALTFSDVENIESLGPEDLDGDISLPSGQDYDISVNGGYATVNFNDTSLSSVVNVDVSDLLATTTTNKVINLPETIVKKSLSNVYIDFGDTLYRFTPVTFNTTAFKAVAQYYDAYSRVTEVSGMSFARAYLQPSVRGKKQVSDVYSITFDATSNEKTQSFSDLTGSIDFTIFYDDKYLTMAKESQIQLYRYNSSTGSYQMVTATLDTSKNKVTARISSAGHYVLLTNY